MNNNWKIVKLGDYIDILSGYAFDSGLFSNNPDDFPLIRIRDIKRGYTETYYSGKIPNDYIITKGDILIGLDGEFNLEKWKGNEALLNQRVCRIKSKNEALLEDYLYYLLPKKLKEIERITSFVTVKHLSVNTIKGIQIPLPPPSEQKRIVSILDKANELIKKRKETVEFLDEYLKSLFLDMFGDPVTNSMNWKKTKLSELGKLDRGVSKHRPRNAPELLGGSHPLIQTGEVANADLFISKYTHTYSEIGLKQSKKWPAGTLCITIAANIAKTGILEFDSCFPDSVVGFIPDEKVTTTIFVHFWLSFLQKILEDSAPESAQKNINLQILRNLDVIVPPIQYQIDFSNKVRSCYLLKQKMERQLNVLENNFQVLLTSTILD